MALFNARSQAELKISTRIQPSDYQLSSGLGIRIVRLFSTNE